MRGLLLEMAEEGIIERNGQKYYTQDAAARYVGRSRTGLADALRRYTDKTGKTIPKMRDGAYSYIKEKDLNALIVEVFPLQAELKGLTKPEE